MKLIQIRNVPDEIHRRAKARAANEGVSLSDYALREIKRAIEAPTQEELMARVRSRRSVNTTESAAEAVRAERDGR